MKFESALAASLGEWGYKKNKQMVFKRNGPVVVKLESYKSRYCDDIYLDVRIVIIGAIADYKPSLVSDAATRIEMLYPQVKPYIHAELSESEARMLSDHMRQVAPQLESLFQIKTLVNLEGDDRWLLIGREFPSKLAALAGAK